MHKTDSEELKAIVMEMMANAKMVLRKAILYIPNPEESKMAFKGSVWQYAKRLKP